MAQTAHCVVMALSLFAVVSTSACGPASSSTPATPTLYGGLNVVKDGAVVATAAQPRLSMMLSDVPICAPHIPQSDFFIITASLVSFNLQGVPQTGLPSLGDFRAASAAIVKALPGSWAVTQVDTYGDPSACGAWDCNPKAQAVPSGGGFISLTAIDATNLDPNVLSADVAFRDLTFEQPGYSGPRAGRAQLEAPCTFSLGAAGPADPNA